MENKKFPTHEHKLAKKTLRDGSNEELTLEDQSGDYVPAQTLPMET
jgi:hypothetical protein